MASMMARLRQVAEEEGLPFGERTSTYNSRLAQELGKWAESKGRGDAFHKAVFRTYFAEGKNIGQIPVLKDVANRVNLPGDEAQEVLASRSFKEGVDQDWLRSQALGVRAVPTFLMNGKVLVGARPEKVLEKFLRDGGAKQR
jgi:predicted DsbA family dithiol-disulfide isomerase